MNAELALIEALTKLLAVIVWPGVALFVLVHFGPGLGGLLGDIGAVVAQGRRLRGVSQAKAGSGIGAHSSGGIASSTGRHSGISRAGRAGRF